MRSLKKATADRTRKESVPESLDAGPPTLAEATSLTPVQHVDQPRRIVVDRPATEFESKPIRARRRGHRVFVPDTVIDAWATDYFCIRAASVRGDSHRYNGLPRQDSFIVAHHAESESIVMAVADGVSSASEAHDGAIEACRLAVAAALASLDQGQLPDWPSIVEGAASGLMELARRATGEDTTVDLAAKMFATTLTVAQMLPSEGRVGLRASSIGDSAIWHICDGHLTRLTGGKGQNIDDLFSPSVAALPWLPSSIELLELLIDPTDTIVVLSDGIGDALGDGSSLVADLLKSELRSPPPPLQVARIADFSRATFADDRTLIAVWPSNPRWGTNG